MPNCVVVSTTFALVGRRVLVASLEVWSTTLAFDRSDVAFDEFDSLPPARVHTERLVGADVARNARQQHDNGGGGPIRGIEAVAFEHAGQPVKLHSPELPRVVDHHGLDRTP